MFWKPQDLSDFFEAISTAVVCAWLINAILALDQTVVEPTSGWVVGKGKVEGGA